MPYRSVPGPIGEPGTLQRCALCERLLAVADQATQLGEMSAQLIDLVG